MHISTVFNWVMVLKHRVFLLFALCACGQAVPPTADLPDTCNRSLLAEFVGQPLSAVEKTLLLQPVRVWRPDSFRTTDFLPNRLNIHVDTADKIMRLSCG